MCALVSVGLFAKNFEPACLRLLIPHFYKQYLCTGYRLNRFATKQERTVRKFNVDQLKTLLLQEITMMRPILILGRLILWLNLKRQLWVYMK